MEGVEKDEQAEGIPDEVTDGPRCLRAGNVDGIVLRALAWLVDMCVICQCRKIN